MNKLEELEKVADQIRKSPPLYKGTTNPVPGEGNPNAEIMFIGEAPGYWEDQKGRPFVGQAGRLLDEFLALIKLQRNNVFIGNIVHWRPPANRDPLPSEIKASEKFIDKQIEIINPRLIVTLGRYSLGKFLPEAKISTVHGQPHEVEWKERGIIVLPLYHPAAALRSADVSEKLRGDFLKIPEILENVKKKEIRQESLL